MDSGSVLILTRNLCVAFNSKIDIFMFEWNFNPTNEAKMKSMATEFP